MCEEGQTHYVRRCLDRGGRFVVERALGDPTDFEAVERLSILTAKMER